MSLGLGGHGRGHRGCDPCDPCTVPRYVIKFLAKLTEYQDMNKMTPSNVAIVLGPNLLWPQAEG